MIMIENLDSWLEDYFAQPENQKKSEKACERYDRLMMKNIRKHMLAGSLEQIDINEISKDDPGKCLEKAKYETLSSVNLGGKEGKLRINLLDKTAEFLG